MFGSIQSPYCNRDGRFRWSRLSGIWLVSCEIRFRPTKDHSRIRTLPSSSCTSYTVRAFVAGPLITAPDVMSNREPWHWHMIVVPFSKPPESGHDASEQVQRSSKA